MADDRRRFVVVGASLTGAKAVEALRAEGFSGAVTLIGEEPERPYERPPLSKDYLRGEVSRDEPFVHKPDFYSAQEIELRISTRADAIEASSKTVVLENGERLPYDSLLLATGAEPRRLGIPGADLGGVHYLRTIADCESLREAIRSATSVVVIGAGWIGAEVAASARQMGAEVALVDMTEVPLERVLGKEVGSVYRDLHSDHGVKLFLGRGVDSFLGEKTVSEVRLTDGHTLSADVVVVGVGVTPRVQLAKKAGLKLDNGIVVDAHLKTSDPNVFAAGDIANSWHPFFNSQIRVEHWANALNQGKAAGMSMLGSTAPYDRLPYFYSDQYDLGMEYSGYALEWDEVVFRGDIAGREFIAFWLKDGRVLAGMNANVWDVNEKVQDLIHSRAHVVASRLADQDVPLEELARQRS